MLFFFLLLHFLVGDNEVLRDGDNVERLMQSQNMPWFCGFESTTLVVNSLLWLQMDQI